MTTEELKIKLNEIKQKYYSLGLDYDGWRIMSTDRFFVKKLKTELDHQLKSHEEIWDISSTEPFKYKDNELDMAYFTIFLSNSKRRLEIEV